MTSPALRCVETVEPPAASPGLRPELHAELWETQQATAGAALAGELARTPGDVAVCGQLGLEQALLGAATRWRKGATIVLDGELAVVETLDPPA